VAAGIDISTQQIRVEEIYRKPVQLNSREKKGEERKSLRKIRDRFKARKTRVFRKGKKIRGISNRFGKKKDNGWVMCAKRSFRGDNLGNSRHNKPSS